MNLNIKVKYKRRIYQDYLCFRHAVKLVIENDEDIEPEIDEFDTENDMRDTSCFFCREETKEKKKS